MRILEKTNNQTPDDALLIHHHLSEIRKYELMIRGLQRQDVPEVRESYRRLVRDYLREFKRYEQRAAQDFPREELRALGKKHKALKGLDRKHKELERMYEQIFSN